MRSSLLVGAVLLAAQVSSSYAQRATDQITVHRLLVDAYVTTGNGAPIRDLTRENFRVRIDGKPAEVESVEAISYDDEADPVAGERHSRRIVFFFQGDMRTVRLLGHRKLIEEAKRLVDTLRPDDLVAVVSYDSHLKLRADFTNDRDVLRKAIDATLYPGYDRFEVPANRVSIGAALDPRAAKRAAKVERALELIAMALRPIDGAKTIVLFGWGFGRLTSLGVRMTPAYEAARRELDASRTTVFSIDVTNADYHSLEEGLQKVADDSGGFYVRGYDFPRSALERLRRTMSVRYELSVKVSGLARGEHDVDVRLIGRRGTVWSRTTYVVGTD